MSDEQEYYSRSEVSNSDLSILAKPNGPQLFKAIKIDRTMVIEPTEAMDLGNMVHCLCLEYPEFGNRYAVQPDGLNRVAKAGKIAWRCFEQTAQIHDLYVCDPKISRKSNAGKAEYELFLQIAGEREIISTEDWQQADLYLNALEANRGKKIVKQDDIAKAKRCAEALMQHEQIGELLRTEAMVEKEYYFEWIGVNCRAKLDWCNLDLGVILDIKTCQDASPAFCKTIWERGYHRQAAFYRQAVLTLTGIECRFLFACVDVNEPHSVGCYEPDAETLARGHDECESLLIEYQTRYESGDWLQEWSKGIVPIGLPPYTRKS